MSDITALLDQAQPGVTITPVALIMEKDGETFRGVFLGFTTFEKVDEHTGDIKDVQVANFFYGNKVYFNMGAQLVRQLQNIPVGTCVQVTLDSQKARKAGTGKTKIYHVDILNIPRVDTADLFGGLLQITAPAAEDLPHTQLLTNGSQGGTLVPSGADVPQPARNSSSDATAPAPSKAKAPIPTKHPDKRTGFFSSTVVEAISGAYDFSIPDIVKYLYASNLVQVDDVEGALGWFALFAKWYFATMDAETAVQNANAGADIPDA